MNRRMQYSIMLTILMASLTPTHSALSQEIIPNEYDYGPYNSGYINQVLPTIDDQTVEIAVYYPAHESKENANPDTSQKPYPTINYIICLKGKLENHRQLAEAFSSWGYIFILTNFREANVTQAFDDATRSLDWVINQNSNETSPLWGMVDETRIATMGHSFGGDCTFYSGLTEPRNKAVISVSPRLYGPGKFLNELIDGVSIPILLVQGGREPLYFDELEEMYNQVTGPKALLTINGATHSTVIINNIVVQYSRYFLDLYLNGGNEFTIDQFDECTQQDIDDGLIGLVYQLESVQEPVEEVTSHQPTTELDDEPNGGIPGYPLWSIALSLIWISIVLSRKQAFIFHR